jgi:hypothetical protein
VEEIPTRPIRPCHADEGDVRGSRQRILGSNAGELVAAEKKMFVMVFWLLVLALCVYVLFFNKPGPT